MSLIFLSSALLAGLVALSIPVLLHLRPHTKVRRLPFAAMRFLRPALRRTSRRLRVQQLLLLLLRLAVFALFVLALARPVLRRSGGAVGETEGPTDLAIVMDTSLSMQCHDGPAPRFVQAQRKAEDILGSLDEGDRASLIVAGSRAETVMELGPDIDRVRDAVRDLKETPFATSVTEAISLALQSLKDSEASNREVCVISDRQQASWAGTVPELASAEMKDRVNVFIVDLGKAESGNLAVIKAETPTDVRQTGKPVPLSAQVCNFGNAPATVMVRLAVDGKFRAEKTIQVPPGASANALFHHPFDERGLHHGFFQIEGDALDADDQRFFAVTVHDGVPVLCLDGDPSDVTFRSETYFLRCALSPGGPEAGGSPFLPKVVSVENLAREDLSLFAAVILANVARLEASQVTTLEGYVNAGGRLLLFPGDRVDRDWHNRSLAGTPDESLLPARLGEPVGTSPEAPRDTGRARTLKDMDFHHPVFRKFHDVSFGDLSTFRFDRVHTLQTDAFPGTRVLARFQDGLPALVEANRGLGKVILTAFPVDSDWGNLPLKTAYLPFIHELVSFAAGHAQMKRDYALGDSVPFSLDLADFGTSITVTTPAGREQKLKGVLKGSLAVAQFDDTTEPGIYRVRFTGTEKEKLSQFAVNVDTRESDLAKIDSDILTRDLQGARVTIVSEAQEAGTFLQKERSGIRLSLPFLYAAVLVYLLESFFSGRFAPQREEVREEEDRVAEAAAVSVRVR